MTHKENIEFEKDILSLYAKTKHAGVESIFIKIATAEITNLHKWLLKNNNIKGLLNNPEVYDTLLFLNQLRGKYAYGTVESKDILPLLLFNRPLIPILMAMSRLINETMSREILLPFKDILDIIGSVYKPGEGTLVSTESVFNDIAKIKNSFIGEEVSDGKDAKRQTISEQRLEMYKNLLYRFNNEISTLAESAGLSDLSQAIKNGALTKPAPISLGNILDFSKDRNYLLPTSKRLSDFVLKNYNSRMTDYNHDMIEATILSKSGLINQDDLLKIKLKHEENKNVMDYLEDDSKKYVGLDLGGIPINDKHINQDYLFLLSCMFVFIQQKIGLPFAF